MRRQTAGLGSRGFATEETKNTYIHTYYIHTGNGERGTGLDGRRPRHSVFDDRKQGPGLLWVRRGPALFLPFLTSATYNVHMQVPDYY